METSHRATSLFITNTVLLLAVMISNVPPNRAGLRIQFYSMSGQAADDPIGDEEQELPTFAKAKRWSWSPTEAYFMNVMIRSCCEVIESGRTMSMHGIHQEVMERWHCRYVVYLLLLVEFRA